MKRSVVSNNLPIKFAWRCLNFNDSWSFHWRSFFISGFEWQKNFNWIPKSSNDNWVSFNTSFETADWSREKVFSIPKIHDVEISSHAIHIMKFLRIEFHQMRSLQIAFRGEKIHFRIYDRKFNHWIMHGNQFQADAVSLITQNLSLKSISSLFHFSSIFQNLNLIHWNSKCCWVQRVGKTEKDKKNLCK